MQADWCLQLVFGHTVPTHTSMKVNEAGVQVQWHVEPEQSQKATEEMEAVWVRSSCFREHHILTERYREHPHKH